MALLVHDNGELQSLRYLVNSNHSIPRNLILKLYSSDTTPAESDVPSQTKYYEPFDATGSVGYGTAPSTGYPSVANNRNDQDYSNQYGILLNGNRWNVRTILTPIATTTATSGTTGQYTITVASTTNIAVGHYVTGTGIGANATVAAINGSTIVLTVANTGTVSGTLEFGVGTTTASYPEQTFTFTSAANNQYGYYLVRANNMPYQIHGVANAATVSASAGIAKTSNIGVIGNNYITLFETIYSPTGTGSVNDFAITVSDATGISTSQRVVGTGIASGAKVTGVNGTTVYVDRKHTGSVSGVTTFYANVTENLSVGMGVTHGFLPGETNAIPSGTKIIGINESTRVVTLSNALLNNIQAATGATVYFNQSQVSTGSTAHGLVAGDVIYIAQGTGNSTTTSSTYTIASVPSSTTFLTSPALDGSGAASLYSSIMFAERFTNGPYNIQNNGDEIKVTLNISLD